MVGPPPSCGRSKCSAVCKVPGAAASGIGGAPQSRPLLLTGVGGGWSKEGPASQSAWDPCTVVLKEMQTSWPSAVRQGFSTWVLRIQGSRDLDRGKNIFFTSFCLKI